MEMPLYYLARAGVAFIQALPLTWVARLGRWGGGLAYWLDKRHRHVALRNLTLCFGHEQSPARLRALARENFRRLGENYACAIKTANMTYEELGPRVSFVGNPILTVVPAQGTPPNVVAAIGHFGNFELYARFGQFAPAYQCGTTYRALRQPSLDRLMQSLRERSGCRYFERRFDAPALKAFMNGSGVIMGFLSDQSGGTVRGPFLGHECATTAAPAIFAQRYHCVLLTAICYRVGLAQWRIEVGAEIPTHENGEPRSAAAIINDVNRTFEAAVRRDPANWFWVHRRWKPAPPEARVSPAPANVSPTLHAPVPKDPGGSQNPDAGQ
jgi:Kdo2-lipid IVA lauroyltransferase/acyltransferase